MGLRFALAVLALGVCACAQYQHVGVDSTPAGAEIFLDGEKVGTTPARLRIQRDKDHSVYLKREGYRPELVVLTLNPTADGIDFLTPADVRVQMLPGLGEPGRDLEVEVEAED